MGLLSTEGRSNLLQITTLYIEHIKVRYYFIQ